MRDVTRAPRYLVDSPAELGPVVSASWKQVFAISISLIIIFYVTEHNSSFAGSSLSQQDEEQVVDSNIDSADHGSRQRRVVLVAFAALGIGLLVTGGKWSYSPHLLGTCLALSLLTWACASTLWAVDPGITVRRLIAWLCFVIGCVGIARRVTSEELLRIAFITLSIFVLTSLLFDLRAGAGPWQSGYRMSGTQHPNVQASYCACLALAGYCMSYSIRPPLLGQAACAIGVLMLYFTNSRTSMLAALFAIAAVWALRQSTATKMWLLGSLVCIAGLVVTTFFALPPHTQRSLTGAALLGRTDKVGTLSGRVPLWEELVGYAADRPLLGYGYDCFWIPGMIEDIHFSQKWSMTSAHNAYLEVVLQLGIVGLVIASLLILVTLVIARNRFRSTGNPGHRYIYGVLIYALMNSLLEAHFVKPKFTTAIAVIGIAQLLIFRPSAQEECPEGELTVHPALEPLPGGTTA